MKKLILAISTFSIAFLGTYVYLDTSRGGDTYEPTTSTTTNHTSFESDESSENKIEQGTESTTQNRVSNDENTNVSYNAPNPQEIGGRWFSLTDDLATLKIADGVDGWHMLNNRGDSMIQVEYTNGQGVSQLATLQANKTSWSLINTNGVVIDGGKVSQ